MSEQQVTLRIMGDAGQLVGTLRVAKSELAALAGTADKAGASVQNAGRSIDETSGKVRSSTRSWNENSTSIGRTSRELQGVASAASRSSGAFGSLGGSSAKANDAFGSLAGRSRQVAAGIDGTAIASTRASQGIAAYAAHTSQLDGVTAGAISRQAAFANTLRGVMAMMGAASVLALARGIGASADAYTDYIGKLQQVTNGERELATAKAATFDIAQRTYQSLDAVGTLYSRSAAALDQYNVSQAKVAELTETVSRGLLISRAGTAESASAILQLSQALGAGALRGEEFNAVNEAAPRLMKLLADSLGVARGELKSMAEDGQLTTQVLLNAFTGPNAAKLASEAAGVPLTMSRAWGLAKNSIQRDIGEINSSLGVTSGAAAAIALVGQHFGLLASAVALAAGAYTGKMIVALAQYVVAQVSAVAASAAGNTGFASLGVSAARASVATTAAAVATRGFAAAVAFLSSASGIGLLITGLGLMYYWFESSAEAASRSGQEIRDSLRGATQELIAFKNAGTNAKIEDLVGTDFIGVIAEAKAKISELRAEKERLTDSPFVWDRDKKLAETTREINLQSHELRNANTQWGEVTTTLANSAIEAMGLSNSNIYLTESVKRLSGQYVSGAIDQAQYDQGLQDIAKQYGGTEAAARVAAVGVANFHNSLNTSFLDNYANKLANLRVQLIGLQNGQLAANDMQFGYDVRAAAIKAGNGDYAKGMQAIGQKGLAEMYNAHQKVQAAQKQVIDEQERQRNVKANVAAGKRADRAAASAAKANQRLNVQRDNKAESAQYSLNNMVEELNGRNMGAVAKVNADYAKKAAEITKITKELADAKRLTAENQQLLTRATEAANAAKARALVIAQREEEADKKKLDIVGNLVEEYERETKAVGLNAREQTIAEAIEKARTEASKQFNDGKRETIDLTELETQKLRDFIGVSYDQRKVAENATAAAEDFKRNWTGAIDSVHNAFTDFMFSGMRDWKSFGDALKGIGRQFIGNIMQQMRQPGGQGVAAQLQKMIFGSDATPANGFGASMSPGTMITGAIDKLSASNNSLLSGVGNLISRMSGAAVMPSSGVAMGQWATGDWVQGMSAPKAPIMSPWMGAAMGGMWGLQRGGDGALGKAGSMSAGLVGGFYAAKGISAAMSAMSAGGGLMGAATSVLQAIPVAGWIALGAIAVDKISGGKLFGTSYKKESSAQGFNITGYGADGFSSVTESKQKALFGGKKYRTTTTGLDAEAEAQVDSMFKSLQKSVGEAAARLNVEMPAMLAASYKSNYDKDGKLTSQGGTINGRNYNESQEAFVARLVGENLLAVAKSAGASSEIEQLAESYRATGEELQSFASFMLAVQSDLKNGTQLWTASTVSITRLTEVVESLGKAGETVAETYGRIIEVSNQYGALVAGVDAQLKTAGLNDFQRQALEIETAYRNQVKQANALAKSLGLAGARTEDLTKFEMLRAMSMAKLQQQMEASRDTFLQDLSLSDLSTLRDDQKLAEAMTQFRSAISGGDLARAQQLSNTALQLGRNLFASGQDYNSLYNEITDGLKGIEMPSLTMDDGTTMGDLAQILIDLPSKFASEFASLIITPAVVDPNTSNGNNANGDNTVKAPELEKLLRDINDKLARQGDSFDALVDVNERALSKQKSDSLANRLAVQ